ncbi:hypothetical protein MMC28_006754 [Mycoblastus sanguinarius]|nr:hypothetical protein [Mycoblastus sanguinarius]
MSKRIPCDLPNGDREGCKHSTCFFSGKSEEGIPIDQNLITATDCKSRIWTLIEATKKVASFFKDVKGADGGRGKIMGELYSLCGLLEQVAKFVENDSNRLPNLTSLFHRNGPLDQYMEIIQGLVPKLTTAHGLAEVAKKCKFVASKKDIQNDMSTLEHYKTTFMAYLNFERCKRS